MKKNFVKKQLIISLIFFIFSAIDKSKESTFFLNYSFSKTILLFAHLGIILLLLSFILLKNSNQFKKCFLFLNKIINNEKFTLINFLFLVLIIITMIIIQIMGDDLIIWAVYQKVFYFSLNIVVILYSLLDYQQEKFSYYSNNLVIKIALLLFSFIILIFISSKLFMMNFDNLLQVTSMFFLLLLSLLILNIRFAKWEIIKIKQIFRYAFYYVIINLFINSFSFFLTSNESISTIYIFLNKFFSILTISFLFSIVILVFIFFIRKKNNNKINFLKLFFLLVFFIFTSINFYSNPLNIVDSSYFKNFQKDSTGRVLGKLINARLDENKSYFLGVYADGDRGEHLAFTSQDIKNTEVIFFYEKSIDDLIFIPYPAHVGIQGNVFGVIVKIFSSISLVDLYYLFELLMVLLLSFLFTLLVLWIGEEFGFISALFVAININFSQWLLVGARNIYWNFWSFYLPMIISIYYFRYIGKGNKPKNTYFFGLLFAVVYIKTGMGIEYLSAVLIMMTLPLFYYGYMYKYSLKKIINYFSGFFITGVLSFFTSVFVLVLKISLFITHDIKLAFVDLNNRIVKRTGFGNLDIVNAIYDQKTASLINESLSVSLQKVFHIYFFENRPLFLNLRAGHITLLLIILLGLGLFFHKNKYIFTKKFWGLLIITLISILAPCSWLVLAKAHSYIHIHLNYINFSMPYIIFVFALLGYFLDNLSKYLFYKGDID